METKDQPAIDFDYEEFEPFCKWRRDEKCDFFEIYGLQDFKKEQLKIKRKLNTLIITGECPLKNNIRNRFRKEIRLSKHWKIDEIRAKFKKRGILYVTLPKKTSSSFSKKGGNSTGFVFAWLALPSNYLAVAVVPLAIVIGGLFVCKNYMSF